MLKKVDLRPAKAPFTLADFFSQTDANTHVSNDLEFVSTDREFLQISFSKVSMTFHTKVIAAQHVCDDKSAKVIGALVGGAENFSPFCFQDSTFSE